MQHPQDGEGDGGSWWTFHNVGLTVLLITMGVLVLMLADQGEDEAHAIGYREGSIEERIRGIDVGAVARHGEVMRQLDDFEREVVLLRLRIDGMNAILDSRGVPPPRQPASLATPEKEP